MRQFIFSLVCTCCLGLFIPSAHAIVVCANSHPAAPAASPANDPAPQVGRLLAGMLAQSEQTTPIFSQYASSANDGWNAYLQTFATPLRAWSAKEVRGREDATVFYPFSGPDLPTVMTIFPGAARYVLISDQYATPYYDPFALNESDRSQVVQALGDSWASFGRLGFFVTQELNKGVGNSRKYRLSPSMILMAFATRLGYEIRAVRPTCLDAQTRSIRTNEAKAARWSSVRLDLRKDGRDVVVDYVQQDLSDHGLRKHPEAMALIEKLAHGPVLLKAASHLPQQPGFSLLVKSIADHTPLLVQDETGLEYAAMAKHFDVRLYGEYLGAHRLFKEATNRSLVQAYKERAKDVRPLNFQLGYQKEAGSAIQIGVRR
jgi:hypothetical protein